MNFKLIFISLCLSILVLGCGGNESNSSSGGGGGGPTQPGGGNTSQNPLLLQVRYNLEGSTAKGLAGTCEILPTDPLGTVKNCNIQMRELIMYYSNFEFSVSTDNKNRCTRVTFEPYYYRRSTDPAFIKDGEADSTVDCTGTVAADSYCYGGAAPSMLDKFPSEKGFYFLTINTLSGLYPLKSNHFRRSDGDGDRSMSHNVGVTNNLPVGSRVPARNNAYVSYAGAEYRDYIVTCMDDWANINYQIVLTMGDDDEVDIPSQTILDYFYDWGL